MMDSDEEEDFVRLGTAVPQVEEDEALPKAGSLLVNQKVRDSRGRQRFHGAFTGGFSAGYFNSVGSKEGWAPKEFTSSRQGRVETSQQTPEDYMDEDDLGEFGISHRKVRASGDFNRSDNQRKRQIESLSGGLLPDHLLETLVVPNRVPIGEMLLSKMGWKHGQGVGPREKRQDESSKVYGCMPSGLLGKSADLSSGLTYAPTDVATVTLKPKNNRHGIGYSGIDPRKAFFSTPETATNKPLTHKEKKEMRGQAFGVGVLNDEDDDVYGMMSIEQYDTVLDDRAFTDDKFGWTAPRSRKKGSRFDPHIGNMSIEEALAGFSLSNSKVKVKLVYPAPLLPPGYRAVKRFTTQAPPPGYVPTLPTHPVEKGLLLGEKLGSVFDLISKEDRQRLEDSNRQPTPTTAPPNVVTPTTAPPSVVTPTTAPSSVVTPNRVDSQPSKPITDTNLSHYPDKGKEDLTRKGLSHQLVVADRGSDVISVPLVQKWKSGAFEPFANEPEKAERYERFRERQTEGVSDAYAGLAVNTMTDWERVREREEFTRAAKLYAPLSSLMSARFTRGRHQDNDDVVMEPEVEDDSMKAARMKMFGKLTRQTFAWYPDKLICKRFNIANPYPTSDLVGIPQVKRDKFSVWNFLGVPAETEPEPEPNDIMDTEPAVSGRQKISFSVGKKHGKQENTDEKKFSIFSDLPDRSIGKNEKEPAGTKKASLQEEETTPESADVADQKRPPIDLFKAIFEDSSDEAESDQDNEDVDVDKDGNKDKDKDVDENKDEVKDESTLTLVVEETTVSEKRIEVKETGTLENEENSELSIFVADEKKDQNNRTSDVRTGGDKTVRFSIFDQPPSNSLNVHNQTENVTENSASETNTFIGLPSVRTDDSVTCSVIGQDRLRDRRSSPVISEDGSRDTTRGTVIGPALPPNFHFVPPTESSHTSLMYKPKSAKKKKVPTATLR